MAVKFVNGINLNNKQLVAMADGSAATDAVTKQQLDGAIRGLDWKPEVMAASTANITLGAPGTTLDGYTLVSGDRIMLKNQTALAENGIYVWTGAAVLLTRALDANTGPQLSGSTVTVQRGTVNADTVWRVTTDDPLVVNTTAVTWVSIGTATSPYIGGNGLVLTGQTFDVGVTAGLVVAADTVGIDTAIVARKYSANCVVTTNPQTFAHGLGTADLVVTVKEGTAVVFPDITIDATNVTVDYGAAPTAAQYRVTAVG